MKISAVILAGGSGRRFGGDLPKQYIEISSRPVLSYTLQAFQECPVDEILIVAGKEYMDMCRRIAGETGITKLAAVIEGGRERYDSVMNGLRYLSEHEGINSAAARETEKRGPDCTQACPGSRDIVLIHDGARPFVNAGVISEIIKSVKEYGAAIAAVPCTDTIKITDEKGMILETTDRSRTWAAQTPQGFWLDDIYRAYDTVLSADRQQKEYPAESAKQRPMPERPEPAASHNRITDDAMVYQLAYPHRTVKTVLSDSDNIKITRPQDLEIADTILQRRHKKRTPSAI